MNDVEAAVHLMSTAKVYKDIFKGDVEHILQQVLQPIKHQILMDDFIKNPVHNSLQTPSKKIQIFFTILQ